MARVGDYDIRRHGDGLWYASYMNFPVSPGYHQKGNARLWARLIGEGVKPEDIQLKSPGDKPISKD